MADINRFMVPAEIPQPSFFQLPYEQMKEGLLSAQKQQDEARATLDATGAVQFKHLTNPNDIALANKVYGYVDKGIEDVVGKQGNGDLRGLRNDINTHARNVAKLFRPDQDIGKLQANEAAFTAWYTKQLENKDLDPTYLARAYNTFINEYDAAGGAAKTNIKTENLLKYHDAAKFVKENKEMIKSTLIANNYDVLGNNGYKYTYEDLIKQLPPERVKQTLTLLLQADPEYNSSLEQRIRLQDLPEESYPILNQVNTKTVDKNGNPIYQYDLNPMNPAAKAIAGAMTGLGVVEESRTGFKIEGDPTWLALWRAQQEKEAAEKEQAMITTKDITQGYTQKAINTLQDNFNGTPEATQELENATTGYRDIVKSYVLNPDGTVKKEFAPYFEGVKDAAGTTIDTEDIINAYTMALHNPSGNLGNGIYVNEKIMRQVLEAKKNDKGEPKYKLNYTLNDGLGKKIGSLLTGLGGSETDITQLNQLGYDGGATGKSTTEQDNFLVARKSMNVALKEYEIKQKQTGATSSQDNYYALDPDTKNPIGKQLQSFEAVSKIASGFNYVDKTTGATGSLESFIKDNPVGGEKIVTAFSPDNNAKNKGGVVWTMTFNEIKKGKVVGTREVVVKPKTGAMINQMEALASEALYRTKKYTEGQPSINTAGNVARTNVTNAIDNSALDQNINAFTTNDEAAAAIINIPSGSTGTAVKKTFKKLTNNAIMLYTSPGIGKVIPFLNESDLKQKLNKEP